MSVDPAVKCVALDLEELISAIGDEPSGPTRHSAGIRFEQSEQTSGIGRGGKQSGADVNGQGQAGLAVDEQGMAVVLEDLEPRTGGALLGVEGG